MVKIFSIEGNIGSGKSTTVKRLQEVFKNDRKFVFLPEPVDQWNLIKDSQGVTILEKYYLDKKRYSFSFQMMAYITRLSQIKKCVETCNDDIIVITERCLYTDYYVFAKMLYDQGLIEEIEYSIYKKWFSEFEEYTKVHGLIYISTTPEICKDRITTRNRTGESVIDLEYLVECNRYHDEWIYKHNGKIIVLDGKSYIDLDKIVEFVKST